MISLLIKPAAQLCNMNCRYCFYHDLTRDRAGGEIMTKDMLHTLADRALSEGKDGVEFMFQGGEPTLAGLDFYRDLVAYVKEHKSPGQVVHYGIQTNGLLLDEDWAAFLKEHQFLVGLSVDGYSDLHNLHRKDTAGKGTYSRVMRSKKLLDRYGVSYNILCVITGAAASHAHRIYHAFQKQGVLYWQFIPCLDPLETERGKELFSLTPKGYAKFLCDLFDDWYQGWAEGSYTSIRFFDDCVNLLVGRRPSSCTMTDECGTYLVIEANGDAYPCDFYVTDEYRLGNIQTQSLFSLMESEREKEFLKSRPRYAPCQHCRYFPVCRGGCRRDYVENGVSVHPYYCKSLQTFFDYAMPRLLKIAQIESRF